MRVMVLTDASFAQREHQLLTRLEIGLADDGAAILHAVPQRCSADILNAFSSTLVRYDDTPTPFGKATRARHVIAAAAEALDTAELKADVVHVFGQGAWSLGESIARAMGAALVLEVWRAELVDDAVVRVRRFSAPGSGGAGSAGVLTSSERIGAELRDSLRRAGVTSNVREGVAPWGVPIGESVRPPIDPEGAIAISVLAEGRNGGGVAEIKVLLEGIQKASRRFDNLLFFLDGTAADRPTVWRAARRLKLLDRITAVAEMEARREPILQTDIIAIPEPDGVCRTLPLQAMGDGVAVLARPDPHHAPWLNEKTARLVGAAGKSAAPEDWERVIVRCIEEQAETASLRGTARAMVREDRTITSYVEGVRRHYDDVLKRSVAPAGAAR